MTRPRIHAAPAALALAAFLLSACVTAAAPENRAATARTLAAAGGLRDRVIAAAPFDLTVYSRITAPGQPLRVYIEGDGLAWIGRRQVSADPTPTDPVALRLAVRDPGPNVVYMARPCQYSRGPGCHKDYWTGARFAPVVIAAMDSALNAVIRDAGTNGVEIIGFSGGGAVAALLAARRQDTLSLRTVAGNLDHAAHSAQHQVTPLSGSLNPPQDAVRLRAIPQHHFTGAEDENITAAIYQAYAAALGPTPCLRHTIVPGVSHEKGWAERWGTLLNSTVSCQR